MKPSARTSSPSARAPALAALAALVALPAVAACRDDAAPRRPSRIALEAPRRATVGLHGHEPTQGPRDAPVSIVAFIDYACPAIGHVPVAFDELHAAHGDRVRIAWKVPPFQVGRSVLPARAACAADLQGRFADMHRRLAAEVPGLGTGITSDRLLAIAGELGLDAARFERDLRGAACTERLRLDLAHAEAAGVRETPTLVVNGLRIGGAMFHLSLPAVVRAELSPGRAADPGRVARAPR